MTTGQCLLLALLLNMTAAVAYPIGTPGKAWGVAEKAKWLETRSIQRSYEEEVISKLEKGFEGFTVHQYGKLVVGKEYPLFVAKCNNWEPNKPCILITGKV
jgi:hypothetical protein